MNYYLNFTPKTLRRISSSRWAKDQAAILSSRKDINGMVWIVESYYMED